MAKGMILAFAVVLFGAAGASRGEGALTDTIGNPASGASKNPPASQLARMRNLNRWRELISTSEDLRKLEAEWERMWIMDKPGHISYQRIHGGLE